MPAVTFIVDVPEPGAAIVEGVKLIATRDGCPDADKETAESKPPETAVVIVETPADPGATLIAVGDALMLKLELPAAVTVRDTEVV